MNKKSPALLFDTHEVDDLILKILSRNRWGLSPDKIRKNLPPSHRISKDQLAARLDGLLRGGRIFRWDPPAEREMKSENPVYSLEPLEPIVTGEIRRLLKDQSLSPAEIKKSFPAHLKKHLLIFLDPLLKERTVKWHPPLKGKRLSLQEPDPAAFLAGEIKKILEKGEKLGFSAEKILQAIQVHIKPTASKGPASLTPEEAERAILKGMTALKPAAAQGALVYIPDLRKALSGSFAEKDSFDRVVLRLARLEKVQLQSHSLPAELTEEERRTMIDNGRGGYFMAIGIRME